MFYFGTLTVPPLAGLSIQKQGLSYEAQEVDGLRGRGRQGEGGEVV